MAVQPVETYKDQDRRKIGVPIISSDKAPGMFVREWEGVDLCEGSLLLLWLEIWGTLVFLLIKQCSTQCSTILFVPVPFLASGTVMGPCIYAFLLPPALQRAAEHCGIDSSVIKLPNTATQEELLTTVSELNNDLTGTTSHWCRDLLG